MPVHALDATVGQMRLSRAIAVVAQVATKLTSVNGKFDPLNFLIPTRTSAVVVRERRLQLCC